MKFLQYVSLIVVTVLAAGCTIETAQPEKLKSLVIASDYLEAKDSVLFESFTKKHNTHIRIEHIDSKQLLGEFKAQKFNSGYDVVMMESLHSVITLNNAGVLHSMEALEEEYPNSPYISTRYNYAGYAMDPFVFAINPDTISRARTYADLKNTDFINMLNENDMITMLSPLLQKMNKVQGYNWIKQLNSHEFKGDHPDKNKLTTIPVALCTYSQTKSFEEDSILSKHTLIHYPNTSTTGTFINLKTICIVHQASNYHTAVEFASAFMQPVMATELCRAKHLFPSGDANNPFKAYRIENEKLIQYYGMIRRILNKLG